MIDPSPCEPQFLRYSPVMPTLFTDLCTFSKILEKLVLARLRPHVLATGNLSSLQSAYRPGCSTESALLKVVGDIERASGNGDVCFILYRLASHRQRVGTVAVCDVRLRDRRCYPITLSPIPSVC